MGENIDWPTDILAQFLAALAAQCEIVAQHSWYRLAFLVCKRKELSDAAKCAPRPILFRIEFEEHAPTIFTIPFEQATVVCVDVDWGDGCVEKLRDKGIGYARHQYAAAGEYAVRVFPAHEDRDTRGVWLDHLGFGSDRRIAAGTESWWQPLREIVSLGKCGVRSLSRLFAFCGKLKIDLRTLNLRNISDTSYMFHGAWEFNQPIGGWNVSNVTNMSRIFLQASAFNQLIGGWNVSNVTDMSRMFLQASAFNQPIGDWNVSNVTNMGKMFSQASAFNQPIGGWNVSNVDNMSGMFQRASAFNQPIGGWNVSNVTKMSRMFSEASAFNQPIGGWNVSNVTDMRAMFLQASAFNQPIGGWNVSNVTNMSGMFQEASAFNQPIGDWKVLPPWK
jgi:surface protein